ncbi:hypothetical protein VJ923_03315 [Adlercreutzia sp. R25]|nr:hypothetical protein [Adlercreutzia sp. R25]MEC4272187.1 hypothetical protein [Adlercreutzia sp. R25]
MRLATNKKGKATGVDYGTIAVNGCHDRKPGRHHDRGCSRP